MSDKYKSKRKTIKKRTIRKIYKRKPYTKKHYFKGGNFGGHCPDPFNYSIYNSSMLKLFPYSPSTFGKG
jgi:hypothetical protein